MNRETLRRWIEENGQLQFSRSGGPGGQNVNKLNTRVTLALPVDELPELSETELERLKRRLAGRISGAGLFQLHSQESRSQNRNREIAIERAVGLIVDSLRTGRKRIPTRPSAGAKRRRISGKKHRGKIKNKRKPPSRDDL